MYTVWDRVRVRVRVRVRDITLQPPQIRCRSKRSRLPSRYDLEVVPCLIDVATGHYACATWKERCTDPARSCMDLVLHYASNGKE